MRTMVEEVREGVGERACKRQGRASECECVLLVCPSFKNARLRLLAPFPSAYCLTTHTHTSTRTPPPPKVRKS